MENKFILGTSFACTWCTVKKAHDILDAKIEDINNKFLISKGLVLSYGQACSTSWVWYIYT